MFYFWIIELLSKIQHPSQIVRNIVFPHYYNVGIKWFLWNKLVEMFYMLVWPYVAHGFSLLERMFPNLATGYRKISKQWICALYVLNMCYICTNTHKICFIIYRFLLFNCMFSFTEVNPTPRNTTLHIWQAIIKP